MLIKDMLHLLVDQVVELRVRISGLEVIVSDTLYANDESTYSVDSSWFNYDRVRKITWRAGSVPTIDL